MFKNCECLILWVDRWVNGLAEVKKLLNEVNEDIGGGKAGSKVFKKEEFVRKKVRGEEAVEKSEESKINLDIFYSALNFVGTNLQEWSKAFEVLIPR